MKTLKFKTKEEASKVINDFVAQEYYGWSEEDKEFNHWYHEEYGDKIYHDINITDDFEKGMELLRKIKPDADVCIYNSEDFLTIAWFEGDNDRPECVGVKLFYSWSFTLWCAIYELITENKIEVGE